MTDAITLTIAIEGKWFGAYGTAPCPVCQPEKRKDQNALTLRDGHDGRLLLHCKKSDCAFLDVLAAAGLRPGGYTPPDAATIARRRAEEEADAARRGEQAKRLWREAVPITGTLAETYLRGRGITCDLPSSLRFHPDCWHGPTAKRYPAMVAEVQGTEFFAVHRTYLRADGTGKANIAPPKAMLGSTRGGAVRLADGPQRLVVGEGIESTLSLASGILEGPAAIWAALSTSGLRGLCLPAQPGRLTIAFDGDYAGREAAHDLAARADPLGWRVDFLDPGTGRDFNDILMDGDLS